MKLRFLPIFIFVFVVLFFFKPVLFENKLPIPSDTIVGLYHPFRDLFSKDYPDGIPFKNSLITDPVRQQYPWRDLVISTTKKFEIPLWNPYNFSGTPLLANIQSAVFYPLNFLFFILPINFGWSILIMLQPLLAGIFLYWYLRNLSIHRIASFLGSIVFAFCGFSVAWMEWGTILHVGLWLPLILLAIDKIFFHISKISNIKYKMSKIHIKNQKFILWGFVFVFSLVSSFFAGHLQVFFYILLFSFVYILARKIQYGKIFNILFVFLIFYILFFILTAIQWIPTLQFILLSARNVDQIAWIKDGWFIPWQHLVQFVVPDFFGNPTTLNYWGDWNYGEFIGYVGILPLVMAIYAMFFRHDKKTIFFGTIFFISLIFALPTYFAKLPYILQIPFLSTSQPTRLLFIIDFSLAVLAALGFDFFVKNKKWSIVYPFIFLTVVFVGLLTSVFYGDSLINSIVPENLTIAKRNLYLPVLTFILSIGTVFAIFINKKILQLILIAILIVATYFIYKRFLATEIVLILLVLPLISLIKNYKNNSLPVALLLISIVILDLFRFGTKFIPFTDQKYLFPPTKTLSFLQKNLGIHRYMTTDSRILPPNFSVMYKLQSVDGYDPLYTSRYAELIAASERDEPNISPPFGFNRIITPHNYDSRIIDLLGVKYILSLSDLDSPELKKVFQEVQTRVYENENVLPRAFFVEKILQAYSKYEAVKSIFDQDFNFRRSAVVEITEGGELIPPLRWKIGVTEIIHYDKNKIVIGTENTGDGFLVLTDSFYPTWRARINKIETYVYRTDYNFRGIIVPEGKHVVTFYNTFL